MRAESIVLLLIFTAAAVLPTPARAGDPVSYGDDSGVYGDDYGAGDFGRITYEENAPRLVRAVADADPVEAASVNAPIFPGDALRTGPDQRAEVQLAGGTVVRVDRDSEVGFEALPDVLADYVDNTVLRLDVGSIRIVVSGTRDDDVFRVDSRAASVYLLGDGDFRVDVDESGATRAVSRRGVLELVGEGGSVLVRGGMRADVMPGYLPSDPRSIGSYDLDGFDRWCLDLDDRARNRARYARAGGYADDDAEASDLPVEVRPYYGELAAHGRWVWVADYGYSWYPYDVAPGWRPYYDGHWSYGPHGWFWVSNEPWGWAPYHYGRWNWVTGYGWCWTPGRIFAGAWVSWSWGSLHFGWAPLDYWGRPAFVRDVYWSYYDPHCWTFIRYEHVRYRDYRRYHVPADRIGDGLARHAVVTRPPRVSPRRLAEVREDRERVVRLAREDRAAAVRPMRRDASPGRRLPDLERSLAERSGRGGGSDRADRRAVRPGQTRGLDPARLGTAGRASAGPATRRGPRGDAAEPSPRFPRQRTADPRARDRDKQAAPPSQARPERRDDPTQDRVRDMYRRLARPRATERSERDRSPSTAPDASRRRAEDASRARPAPPAREAPRARPQQQPPRREAPRATPQQQQPRRDTSRAQGSRTAGSGSSGARPSRGSSGSGSGRSGSRGDGGKGKGKKK